MNFVNLCDDIIEMVSDQVKNHPKYKFRNTLKDINYYGGNYEKDDPFVDYEEIKMNLWNRRCQICHPKDITRLPMDKAYALKKQRLLNYWEMRFIHEVNDGYGMSCYQRIQNDQGDKLYYLDGQEQIRMFYMNPEIFKKDGYIVEVNIKKTGIIYRLIEDESSSSDGEPDWDDEGHPF